MASASGHWVRDAPAKAIPSTRPMFKPLAGGIIMDQQAHIVSGIYTSRAEAEAVRDRLVASGVLREQVSIADDARAATSSKMVEDDEALRDVVVDGAVGAAVGTGLGVVAEVALIAANVTLFVASPLIGPLALLGWGAALGGLVGAAVGAEKPDERKEGKFSDFVLDAIRSGHVVLVAQTRTEAEATLVRDIVGDSLATRS
jgi:hypothetical protein